MADSSPVRHTRRWVLGVLAVPVVVVAVTAAISAGGPPAPTVAVTPPSGYRVIADAYYGYAVPVAWRENDSATTDTGVYYYQGAGGWAGEVLVERSSPPPTAEPGPAALGIFGTPRAVPFTLTPTGPAGVTGTTTARSFRLERGGAVVASVVEAWSSSSRTEVWLAVHAEPTTTATVLGSLRA